jgi:hypothetical protein
MGTQTIEILSQERELFTTEAEVFGRFAVHHSMEEDTNGRNFISDNRYTVTHVATGRCTHGFPILLRQKAILFAQFLDSYFDEAIINAGLEAQEKGENLEFYKTYYGGIRQAYETEYGALYADYMPYDEDEA